MAIESSDDLSDKHLRPSTVEAALEGAEMSLGLPTADYHNLADVSAGSRRTNHVFKLKPCHGLRSGLEFQSSAYSKARLQMDCFDAIELTLPPRWSKAR